MAFEAVTEEHLRALKTMPKELTNPNARRIAKGKFDQISYEVLSVNREEQFEVFVRQNRMPNMESDFSCGICWLPKGSSRLILARYNGATHFHINNLESTTIGRVEHIHVATERYIKAGKKAEGYAEFTNRYTKSEGALICLLSDFNIRHNIEITFDEKQIELPFDGA